MMFQLIKFITFYFFVVSGVVASNVCDSKTTPLWGDGSQQCEFFLKADKSLNKNYQSLISKLSSNKVTELRAIQREWLKWRDERCDLIATEDQSCSNSKCQATKHNYCIVNLTNTRSDELKNTLIDASEGKDANFKFSKKDPEI